jgi:tetratricopeptide (TPR) repeat protein
MTEPSAEKLYRKMFDAWNRGEHALALELSRDLLRQSPRYDIAWLLQGVILYELARYTDAEKTLRRAVQLIPDASLDHGYVHLGHLCKHRGDFEKAELYYRKALALAPENAARHIFLGALLAIKGDLEAAEKVHRDGTGCSEGRMDEAYLNLGLVLRAQERYAEALECFTKVFDLSPDNEEATIAKRDMELVLEYLGDEA